MEKRKLLGIVFILIGFVFILNSFSGITGFVVAESIGKGISGILGLVFIIGGILVFMSRRKEIEERKNKEGNLIRIIRSRKFRNSTKRAPKKIIEDTIDKIDTDLAYVHNLEGKYKGYKAINSTKGGRIVYEKKRDIFTLKDYLPSHNY